MIDKQTGQVVGAAHIDPDSGEWVEGVDNDGPSAVPHDARGRRRHRADRRDRRDGHRDRRGRAAAAESDGPDVVTVEAGGHTIGVVETVDNRRRRPGRQRRDLRRTAARSSSTNTDDDPEAEQVAVVDPETGQVVEVAHVNPETGEWEEGPAPGYGGAAEDGTGSGFRRWLGRLGGGSGDDGGYGGGSNDGGTDGTEAGTTTGGGSMTVEVDGQTRDLPADKDYTGDGRPDAATETSDGKVIIFADTEDNETGEAGPDGKADEAYIIDKQTGQVVRRGARGPEHRRVGRRCGHRRRAGGPQPGQLS